MIRGRRGRIALFNLHSKTRALLIQHSVVNQLYMCIKNVGLIFLFAAFTVFPAFGHCGAETLGARIHRVLPGSVSPETVSYANEVEARIAASLAKGDYPRLLRYDIGAIISLVARDHDVQVIAHHDVIAIIDAIKRILPQRTTQRLVDELMTCERSACPAGGLTLPQSQDKSARNRDYARRSWLPRSSRVHVPHLRQLRLGRWRNLWRGGGRSAIQRRIPPHSNLSPNIQTPPVGECELAARPRATFGRHGSGRSGHGYEFNAHSQDLSASAGYLKKPTNISLLDRGTLISALAKQPPILDRERPYHQGRNYVIEFELVI